MASVGANPYGAHAEQARRQTLVEARRQTMAVPIPAAAGGNPYSAQAEARRQTIARQATRRRCVPDKCCRKRPPTEALCRSHFSSHVLRHEAQLWYSR